MRPRCASTSRSDPSYASRRSSGVTERSVLGAVLGTAGGSLPRHARSRKGKIRRRCHAPGIPDSSGVSPASSPSSPPPDFDTTLSASSTHWQTFWSTGGALDLSQSRDPRWKELERRCTLSQYLTALNCSGPLPPPETGLTCNSWFGKFHLEMHPWHAAHFALWSRPHLLERSLPYYLSILPSAQSRARQQGYSGARWPKMTDPSGTDSPSNVGPFLIWQQPHPILLLELLHRTYSHPSFSSRACATCPTTPNDLLSRYAPLVHQTATFISSYAYLDPTTSHYTLGPPLIPAQENHPPRETCNPTFELAYWRHALALAQQWRQRLHQPPNPHWSDILTHLSPLPTADGLYLAHANCPQTFTSRNHDHPSMLYALGLLPPGPHLDPDTMRRTLQKVLTCWDWPSTWGWDFGAMSLTAARLHDPHLALDLLLMDTPKNTYLPNGHNHQRPNLPCYLPGNGSLLLALASMCAGFHTSPPNSPPTPGFPNDWIPLHENLLPLL